MKAVNDASGSSRTDERVPLNELLYRVQQNDQEAIRLLFAQYYPLLRNIADRRLAKWLRRSVDGSEIAQSAVRTFFRRMTAGELGPPDGEGQLLVLLTRLLARKLTKTGRHLKAEKRGPRSEDGQPIVPSDDGLESHAGDHPSPVDEVVCDELLDMLLSEADEQTTQIILMRLDGMENDQIADHLRVSTRTVQRRLSLTRQRWEQLQDLNS